MTLKTCKVVCYKCCILLQLFAILFFVMLFVLGVGSLVALQGCCNVVIMDAFPSLKAWQVSTGTAIAGFLVGLVYVTPVCNDTFIVIKMKVVLKF